MPARKFCCRKYAGVADPPRHWHVYVIELGGSDGKRTDPRTVYVGQTALTPQARFDNHRRGVRAARRVRGADSGCAGVCSTRGIRWRHVRPPRRLRRSWRPGCVQPAGTAYTAVTETEEMTGIMNIDSVTGTVL
jgi:hypothetical protein